MHDGATDTVNAWAFLVAIVIGVPFGIVVFFGFVDQCIVKPFRKDPKGFVVGTIINIVLIVVMCWVVFGVIPDWLTHN